MDNYLPSDVNYRVQISNEKNVTIDDVVNEADAMWSVVKRRKIPIDDCESAEALMTEMRKKHPQFSKSYPMVLRYMCQMHSYTTKAFRTYLRKIAYHPYTSEVEYLNSQADYVVILYKSKNPKWNAREAANLRRNIRDALQREHDDFKKKVEIADVENTLNTDRLKKLCDDELRDFALQLGTEGMKAAGTVRVESDITSGEFVDIDAMAQAMDPDTTTADSADDLLS